jgi:hypothetical protein
LSCKSCLAKQLRIDELEAQVARLQSQLRYQKRTAAEGPFGSSTPSSKKPFKANSSEEEQKKRGGAKRGHPGHGRNAITTDDAEEIVDVDVSGVCPHCGTPMQDAGICCRSVIDAEEFRPRRIQYRLRRRRCPACKKVIRAPAPGVLPKNLYGNQLLSEVAVGHYLHGTPLGRLAAQLHLPLSGLIEAMHRLARLFANVPEHLKQEYRRSPVRHADETGWRNDGGSGYAWLFCTPKLSLYLFRKTRSSSVVQDVMGKKPLPGILVVDRYSAYNRVPCRLQYCYAHLLREVKNLEIEDPDDEEVWAFVSVMKPALSAACGLRGQGLSRPTFLRKASAVKAEIISAVERPAMNPGIQHIQNIFRDHADRMYHWATDPSIPAENNLAERNLRPTVIARKASYGSQSDEGAQTREILMSVLHTLKQRVSDPRQHFKGVLDQLALQPNKNPIPMLFASDRSDGQDGDSHRRC